MNKRMRQYIGILAALVAYYIVHEGAHLIIAFLFGVFKRVRFLGLGIQIDVNNVEMTETQMFIFCLVGALSTFIAGYLLIALRKVICQAKSKVFRAVMYYITMAMLLLDPLYLSILCGFFGGGDMNGIALFVQEWIARIIFGILLLVNGGMFWKMVLPIYKLSFEKEF